MLNIIHHYPHPNLPSWTQISTLLDHLVNMLIPGSGGTFLNVLDIIWCSHSAAWDAWVICGLLKSLPPLVALALS